MINLMLVDDHVMLREGLRRKFEDNPNIRVTAEAGSANEAMQVLSKARIDLVILDIKLPDGDGFSMIKKIKLAVPRVKIIILTIYDHARYALRALECGADGFVIKGAPFAELLKGVMTVSRGGTYVCPEVAGGLLGRFRPKKQAELAVDGLSKREFDVLGMLGSGLAVKETADRLGISQKTVSTYRTRLMQKLHLASNADVVRFAMEAGLVE